MFSSTFTAQLALAHAVKGEVELSDDLVTPTMRDMSSASTWGMNVHGAVS
jgi:hypothetical protein